MSSSLDRVEREQWEGYAKTLGSVFELARSPSVNAALWDRDSHEQALSWARLFGVHDGTEAESDVRAMLAASGVSLPRTEPLSALPQALEAVLLANPVVECDLEVTTTVLAGMEDAGEREKVVERLSSSVRSQALDMALGEVADAVAVSSGVAGFVAEQAREELVQVLSPRQREESVSIEWLEGMMMGGGGGEGRGVEESVCRVVWEALAPGTSTSCAHLVERLVELLDGNGYYAYWSLPPPVLNALASISLPFLNIYVRDAQALLSAERLSCASQNQPYDPSTSISGAERRLSSLCRVSPLAARIVDRVFTATTNE